MVGGRGWSYFLFDNSCSFYGWQSPHHIRCRGGTRFGKRRSTATPAGSPTPGCFSWPAGPSQAGCSLSRMHSDKTRSQFSGSDAQGYPESGREKSCKDRNVSILSSPSFFNPPRAALSPVKALGPALQLLTLLLQLVRTAATVSDLTSSREPPFLDREGTCLPSRCARLGQDSESPCASLCLEQ